MKLIKRIFLGIVLLLTVGAIALFVYLQMQKPQYDGEVAISNLHSTTEVLYDEYGVPHIYGEDLEDLYRSLGYVHAQDRLFQMEMLRRVGGGRLSEILGADFVKTDQFFRTLGIAENSKQAVDLYFGEIDKPEEVYTLAYLDGINQYMANNTLPAEYAIMGIPEEEFTVEDVYNITGYMAFSFAAAFKVDPLVTKIHRDLGPEYLNSLAVDWPEGAELIPINNPDLPDSVILEATAGESITQMLEKLPVPLIMGSNGWVLSGKRTKSGKVLFSNDTHIGYSQPAVWYEAHLEGAGFSVYGNHLGGFPFPLVGHTRRHAWGLTMFENDDIDFYVEKQHPDDENLVRQEGEWIPLVIRKDTIKVKGGDDIVFEIKKSSHGPIVNKVVDAVGELEKNPVACWWTFTQKPANLLGVAYSFSHAKNMAEFKEGVSELRAPGLNVMYGDAEGNIAWWAAASIPDRPTHVHPKMFLGGESGEDDYKSFLDFSYNPKLENPESGFVYSANNQPDTVAGRLYHGYYVPEDRGLKIRQMLEKAEGWGVDEMKNMINDNTSPVTIEICEELLKIAGQEGAFGKSDTHERALNLLANWDGACEIDIAAPTIYYQWLGWIVQLTFEDELGEKDFSTFRSTHFMKRSLDKLIHNEAALWWDNSKTAEKETRGATVIAALDSALLQLVNGIGQDPEIWLWGLSHTLEHGHVLGSQAPLDKFFNVGPFPMDGSNETINNQVITISTDLEHKVKVGPAMRIIIDFDDIENAICVLPTGQSGNFMSPHYSDQAELFVNGKFRKMMMNEGEIREKSKHILMLKSE
ncbi:penicillin acylase family protein [Flammeovirgaceae bacterium SG7u.111]|nr:penicillin acylase family protein [Flammeovirgaceae bacterium SG7u.132]WPO33751.1 penicillin acylase family protein [Flammeovirgaceae bacterium SG7u.111]